MHLENENCQLYIPNVTIVTFVNYIIIRNSLKLISAACGLWNLWPGTLLNNLLFNIDL
jgi:hypothetical protein